MNTYRFRGSAYRFGVCVAKDLDITTKAPTLQKAANNIKFRIKQQLGLTAGSTLEISLNDIQVLVPTRPEQSKSKSNQVEDRQLTIDDAMKNIGENTKMRKFVRQPKAIRAAQDEDLSTMAENIADSLADFLNLAGRLSNREDYLDEYDMEALGNSYDCLIDFAQMYNHGDK